MLLLHLLYHTSFVLSCQIVSYFTIHVSHLSHTIRLNQLFIVCLLYFSYCVFVLFIYFINYLLFENPPIQFFSKLLSKPNNFLKKNINADCTIIQIFPLKICYFYLFDELNQTSVCNTICKTIVSKGQQSLGLLHQNCFVSLFVSVNHY